MKVIGINGSLRKESWNRKLLRLALNVLEQKGVEAEEFDLNPVPIYSGDLEAQGQPQPVINLRNAVERADAVIITSPEYNHTFSAAIKNCIEWLSRSPNLMDDKLFVVMASSPGKLGAGKIHMPLSYALESEGAWVLHQPKILVPLIDQVISQDGKLLDDTLGQLLENTMTALIAKHKRLNG